MGVYAYMKCLDRLLVRTFGGQILLSASLRYGLWTHCTLFVTMANFIKLDILIQCGMPKKGVVIS
jgi:hypothetical protein